MSRTEDEADLLLTAAIGGTAYQGPATYYAELVTTTPTRTTAGTASTLGRILVTCATDITNNGDGTCDNATVWTWDGPATDLSECTYLELWTASTGGTRKYFEMLTSPVIPQAGVDVTIPIGSFTWTEV